MEQRSDPIRVNDAERDAVVVRLREAVGAGYLELEEFSDRVAQALAADHREALELVISDLPLPVAQAHSRRATRWILGILGGGNHTGRWRVAERLWVFNLMGGADLDLRSATISARVTKITVLSIMGGSNIVVPDGVEVEVTGFALLGGNDLELDGSDPPVGSPLVSVRAFTILGGTDVRTARFRAQRV